MPLRLIFMGTPEFAVPALRELPLPKTGAGKIAYHIPCHLRTQNIGYKTRDMLALLPDTQVELVEACSGHNGTWAMKKENFEASLKWGERAFQGIRNAEPDVTCSDCPLAAIQILWINLVTDGLPALALAMAAVAPEDYHRALQAAGFTP